MFSRGKRHVRRANLERHDVVAEGAEGERHDAEEHHDGAVHGPELVVELREKNAAGSVGLAEPSADERDGLCREGLLPSDQHHEGETHQQEEQAGEPVLQADDLMVRGKNVPAYQSWHLTQPCETRASEWCIFLAAFEGARTVHLSIEELRSMRLSPYRVAVTSACFMLRRCVRGLRPARQSHRPQQRPAPVASAESQIERGHLLIIGGGCHDCHTPKKIGPNGPEADMDRMLSGHPESEGVAAAIQANQGQPLCDPHQRSPDRVERRLGRVVCREPDARSEHRPRHLDRGHVPRRAQAGKAHGQRAGRFCRRCRGTGTGSCLTKI